MSNCLRRRSIQGFYLLFLICCIQSPLTAHALRTGLRVDGVAVGVQRAESLRLVGRVPRAPFERYESGSFEVLKPPFFYAPSVS